MLFWAGISPPSVGPNSVRPGADAAGPYKTPSWGQRFNAGFNRMFGRFLDYYEYWVRRALVRPGRTVALGDAPFATAAVLPAAMGGPAALA